MAKKKLLMIITNHFDLAWRRCFERKIEWDGRYYIPYTDLQAQYIIENINFASEFADYKFEIETVAVVRHFLEKHPEYRETLKRLVDEGRVYVPCSGDNIIDSNMVHGESLVRNYLTGILWTEENLGYTPRLAVRNDAFGNSAQLPQIFRGCGIKWVTGFGYSPCQGRYWRGLDGSTILQATLPTVGNGGGWLKYAPCPECLGKGEVNQSPCPVCSGLGIDRAAMGEEIYNIHLNEDAFGEYDAGFVIVGGEELLPSKKTIEWAHNQKDYDVVFALEEEALPYIQKLLDQTEEADLPDLHPSVELNPNNTGCYVSRIQTKQTARRQEYALLNLEALATLAFMRTGNYPRKELAVLWKQYLFTAAHDSITAEHVDDVYFDLIALWPIIDEQIQSLTADSALKLTVPQENAVSVFNPTGDYASEIVCIERDISEFPLLFSDEQGNYLYPLEATKCDDKIIYKLFVKDVPPFGTRVYTMEKDTKFKDTKDTAEDIFASGAVGHSNILQDTVIQANTNQQSEQKTFCIENERYLVEADLYGILGIRDKKLGCLISQAEEYRPGEYILEHDEGSPWATLSADMKQIPLSRYTRLTKIIRENGFQRMTFVVEDFGLTTSYAIQAFRIVYHVTLYAGTSRVEFESQVDWNDYNHRLRIAFPVKTTGRAYYEIPYGVLERKAYEPSYSWAGSNGDWPAINWAGVEGENFSIALLNRGTPSYKVENTKSGAVIMLSVLRSPCIPTYLHEPHSYSMTKWEGMRDAGKHHFAYALTAYGERFAESKIVADANGYNSGMYVVQGVLKSEQAPLANCNHAHITSLKVGEKENCLIVRLVEYAGNSGSVNIVAPTKFPVISRVNLLEREDALLGENVSQIQIKPFEIVTLKFTDSAAKN